MARVEYALLATLAALRLTYVLPYVSKGYVCLCQSYACRVYCCYVKALKAHLLLFCMLEGTVTSQEFLSPPPSPKLSTGYTQCYPQRP